MIVRVLVVCAIGLLLACCAAPPLKVFTLDAPATGSSAPPLGVKPMVIEVARVAVPDDLDTEDLVVRDGSALRRSQRGRWASRLSLGITERLTSRLAERRPDALVTNRPQTQAPAYRILVNVGRLDVTAEGAIVLEADWLIVPRDAASPSRRDRARFTASGSVATDQDVVTLIGTVLDRLAGVIVIGKPVR